MLNRADLVKAIDHTVLRPDSTLDDVLRACDEAERYHFASVVVLPCWVFQTAQRLGGGEVKVGTVVGFPLGADPTRVKVTAVESAVAMGAQEIEAVINISALKSGDMTRFRRDLEDVLNASHLHGITREAQETLTKFVLETSYLNGHEVAVVSELVREIGGEFLVTSTGYAPGGANTDNVRLIRRSVGATMGVKAVGGIRTLRSATALLNAGANRIGTSAGVHIVEEFVAAGQERDVLASGRR